MQMQQGFVKHKECGTTMHDQIADPTIYALCDLVCDRIQQQYSSQARRATPSVFISKR